MLHKSQLASSATGQAGAVRVSRPSWVASWSSILSGLKISATHWMHLDGHLFSGLNSLFPGLCCNTYGLDQVAPTQLEFWGFSFEAGMGGGSLGRVVFQDAAKGILGCEVVSQRGEHVDSATNTHTYIANKYTYIYSKC